MKAAMSIQRVLVVILSSFQQGSSANTRDWLFRIARPVKSGSAGAGVDTIAKGFCQMGAGYPPVSL